MQLNFFLTVLLASMAAAGVIIPDACAQSKRSLVPRVPVPLDARVRSPFPDLTLQEILTPSL